MQADVGRERCPNLLCQTGESGLSSNGAATMFRVSTLGSVVPQVWVWGPVCAGLGLALAGLLLWARSLGN